MPASTPSRIPVGRLHPPTEHAAVTLTCGNSYREQRGITASRAGNDRLIWPIADARGDDLLPFGGFAAETVAQSSPPILRHRGALPTGVPVGAGPHGFVSPAAQRLRTERPKGT